MLLNGNTPVGVGERFYVEILPSGELVRSNSSFARLFPEPLFQKNLSPQSQPCFAESLRRLLEEGACHAHFTLATAETELPMRWRLERTEGSATIRMIGQLASGKKANPQPIDPAGFFRKYQALTQHVSDCVVLLDAEGFPLEVSPNAERILGITEYELVGVKRSDVVHPDDLPLLAAIFYQAKRQPGVRFVEAFRLRHTSDERWLEAAFNNQLHNTNLQAIVVSVRDVTALKLAERSQVLAQQRLAAIVNDVEGIVWEADAQSFDFTYVSKKAERILGYPVQQWYEPGFWSRVVYAPDLPAAAAVCKRATKRLRDHVMEYRMVTADGRLRWIKDIVSVLSENGQPSKLRGIMLDITFEKNQTLELLAKEEKFKTLLEHSTESTLILDRRGRIKYIAPSATFVVGYNPDALLGTSAFAFVPETERTVVEQRFQALLQNPGMAIKETLPLRNAAGDYIMAELFVKNMQYNANIRGVLIHLRDVTERIELEKAHLRELAQHQQALLTAEIIGREREKEFIAHELHDNINQLLTTAKLLAEMAGKPGQDPKPLADRCTAVLAEAIQEIRKLSARMVAKDLTNAGLQASIRSLLVNVQQVKEVTVNVRLDPRLEQVFDAAAQKQLYRIVQEQVTNIVKHAGTVTQLAITARFEGKDCVLEVADDGQGFDPAQKAAGLGMSSIRNRATVLGGQATWRSSVGKGCLLKIRIPVP